MSCLLYGCGGIGVVAVEVARASGVEIGAFIDDDPERTGFLGVAVRRGLTLDPTFAPAAGETLCVCLGDNARRAELCALFRASLRTIVHPSALVSPTAHLAAGTLVFHAARVQANTRIGEGAILNTGASVDHDCVIGDHVHVGPSTTLCGFVEVGTGANIGAGVTVIPGRRIGAWSTVGAGAVIIDDVPERSTVVGCPARVVRRAADADDVDNAR